MVRQRVSFSLETKKPRPAHYVKQVRKRLADGRERIYRYDRLTGDRVFSEPGTPEFEQERAVVRGERLKTAPPKLVRHVYFIRAESTGLIKIGVADSVRHRFMGLQSASPDKLTLLGSLVCTERGALEKRLHRHFAEDRSHGEWFRPSAALLRFIVDKVTFT